MGKVDSLSHFKEAKMSSQVQVGLGLILINQQGKILIGERQGSHAAGLMAFPGGGLEFNETLVDGCHREFKEECGDAVIKFRKFNDFDYLFVTNNIMTQYGKHYVTFFLVADYISGEIICVEPEKCKGWNWVFFDDLKQFHNADWIPCDILQKYRKLLNI